MLLEQQKQLISLIQAAVAQCLPEAQAQVQLERPKVAAHGDIATNVAMQLAKPARRNPRELAQGIVDALMAQPQARELIQDAEIAGPGFINFRLTPAARQAVVQAVASQADAYGRAPRNGEKVLVEFVSANPTGPLHVGHARQAALGDAICRLYDASGWDVTREFYYNDAGNQIDNLAISVQARGRGIAPDAPDYPADGYKGDYIVEIARDFAARKSVQASDGQPVTATGDLDSLDDIRAFAVAYLRREQDLDLQAFGLAFDNYFLESSLYASGRVQETVDTLVAKGHTYEEGGALWLRTTELGTGDDKDRVMRKSEGGYTYFVPDVAYHKVKWERGFHHAVNIQGSDHHGTVARVRAGLQGLAGIPKDFPAYVLHKMVKVMRGGEEVKISKRAGSYVTMRDLIDWVGRDAVRYFLIQRRADTEFVFDIDLALSKSDENPVYYIQYAHARICTMIGNSGASAAEIAQADTALLTAPSEYALLQRLAEFPQVVALAAQELAPHHVAFWLRDCASDFHAWYNAERVLVDEPALKLARLRLAATTRQVLANGLALLGVSAPDRM
ncbi:arginyl-tRNA synthetase [Bordetella pertussis]|uniref:Arginine--tRNA ligase n=4 Tax=Bordetella pertussis TaxID=520 RepID=SYR_BORPE|nr:arginine--tRNA ligase [Bordetella pertussis]Q7W0K0.2 RecName: Full=Arginine--tRNA ligase; AltName: Full=Arginyl-tRNA synthetase; Short=ArgRS [Bordetella pertussis Tohama I]ETH40534.1 arginine--tRNA ligase [Bordetella pertussis H918]ETH43937.1 arginine--tRNA ligase [Bordetella pertussis H939]ETH48565.1 arginine--tRNA ligase [Bordetella pertussis H921]ETH73171.1 arginine--tRNA ligase [Bordetella pertussis STO1-CHLA-0011]ETH84975.1 arginine--tRNA ligase [Bordetella pertussis STO1-CHOC-0017]E